jgi:hypothetical protein
MIAYRAVMLLCHKINGVHHTFAIIAVRCGQRKDGA